MTIDQALNLGFWVTGIGPKVLYADPSHKLIAEGEKRIDMTWDAESAPLLRDWLAKHHQNRFTVSKINRVVLNCQGHERVTVPADLLEGVKEDGEDRVWTQGGYTFGVSKDGDDILTALIGIPEGGSASQAWVQPVTRTGYGETFAEAVTDAFNDDVPLDS